MDDKNFRQNSILFRVMLCVVSTTAGCLQPLNGHKASLPESLIEKTSDSQAPVISKYALAAQKENEKLEPLVPLVELPTSPNSDSNPPTTAAAATKPISATKNPSANNKKPVKSGAELDPIVDEIEQVLSAPNDVSPEKFDQLEKKLADSENGLPSLYRQQLVGLLEMSRRNAEQFKNADVTELRPNSNHAESPTKQNNSANKKLPRTVAQMRDAESLATPHVTVNVTTAPAASISEPANPAGSKTELPTNPPATPLAEKQNRVPALNPNQQQQPAIAANGSLSAKTENDKFDTKIGDEKGKQVPERNVRPGQWRESLLTAIDALDAELRQDNSSIRSEDKVRFATYLRLLDVVADRRDDAVREIEGMNKPQKEFWKKQLHALAISLDSDGIPVESRRSALALRNLREATYHLAADSTLDVRNLAFCTKVDGYGTYAEFPKAEFKPDQEVLLYVEIDNFTTEEKPLSRKTPNYETELRGSYQILDANNRRIADVELPTDKQVCRNHRRDYFIAYRLYIPKRMEPGTYTLQLTIEDVKGQKFGTSSIELTIKP